VIGWVAWRCMRVLCGLTISLFSSLPNTWRNLDCLTARNDMVKEGECRNRCGSHAKKKGGSTYGNFLGKLGKNIEKIATCSDFF
jgi:hypothetical protein